MSVDGPVSEPLRSLLEFESVKHNVPFRYRRTHLRYWRPDESFEPLIDVVVHTDPNPQPFAVPTGELLLKVRTAVCDHPIPNAVGPTIDGETIPVAYLDGRHIVVPFDLEDLENLNGVPNPVNHLWSLIAEWAIPAALESVRSYDFAKERAAYAKSKLAAFERTIQRIRRDIQDNAYDIDNHTNQILELVRKNDELKTTLTLFETPGREHKTREAEIEFDDLMRLVPGAYRRIDVSHDPLVAETGPITITHRSHSYDLGRFQVTIDLFSDRLTILNQNADRIRNGYHHPHVDSTGHPCLGNISLSLAKLLTLKQYAPALVLIRRFLESYNPDNPYIAIERWDEGAENEDDEDFESCFESSSVWDCNDCRNSACPYWEDRYVRCDEDSTLERCLGCRECDAWRARVETCWEDVSPREECMEACSHEACPHWRNADDCYEAHDGEECADCPNTTCEKHAEHEEDADDPSPDRPAHP